MTKEIIFDYIEYPLMKGGSKDKPSSFKPMIEIQINEKKSIYALLDSGADNSLSFKHIGEGWFGLKILPKDKIKKDISGFHTCPDFKCKKHPKNAPVFQKPYTFDIDGIKVILNIYWIDRGYNPKDDVTFILGRDFFEYFDITFKQKEKKFILRPR